MSLFLVFLLEMGIGGWPWLVCVFPASALELEGSFCSILGRSVSENVYKPGDVIIGGLIPVHFQAPEPDLSFTQTSLSSKCHDFNLRSYRWLQTMIFAVEEINRNTELLPNVTLGYMVADTCLAEGTTLAAALGLVAGQKQSVLCSGGEHSLEVPVIIGDARSSASIGIARTLGSFNIPLVSYFASCACLSDRKKYPTFFRTVPSDAFQARAMARLLRVLGWTWVGVVAGEDDYGKFGIQLLLEELRSSEVCVAFFEIIPKVYAEWRIKNIVDTIRLSTAKVIVTFAISPDMHILLMEVLNQNITDKQWIATEAWASSPPSGTPNVASLVGTIGFALRKADIQGLKPFLTRLLPSEFTPDPFLGEFWETTFMCSVGEKPLSSWSTWPRCSGSESLKDVENIYTDVLELRVSYNVYKAVYAIAHAIHKMLACRQGEGPFENRTCPNVSKLQPWQIIHYLRNLNFTTPVGETIYFDENGDPTASYDIINWHADERGVVKFVKVGQYDSGVQRDFDLEVKKVVWGGGQKKVPVSICSSPCPPGTWKAAQKGKPVCCFDCLPCSEGHISNATGSTECRKCPDRFWSNTQKTECVMKEEEFLSFEETMGIILAVLSVSGALLTTAVTGIFFCHRDTPLVRANNSELSFLLLLSLTLCFLCALAFIGRPNPWSCKLRHTLFGISFVLSISCLLSKTVVVLVAFRSTLPGSTSMRYFGPIQQRVGLSLCTSIQVLVCVLWLVLAPPYPSENLAVSAKVVLECGMGSVVGFACVLGYICLLAGVCFLLAFLARKLPDNFNEAKFITFSMLIFCAVWITFVPAYVSSPGKYTVAVEIFAILASSYGLLLCIFAPKCYIILLKPEKNTKKNMMAK